MATHFLLDFARCNPFSIRVSLPNARYFTIELCPLDDMQTLTCSFIFSSSQPSAVMPRDHVFQIFIAYEDEYVQPLILAALSSVCQKQTYLLLSEPQSENLTSPCLQISAYESIAHSSLLEYPRTYFANTFIIRKALIRKHFLAHIIESYIAKHPHSLLKSHVPTTLPLELDYAEFLDEALLEAYELHESWTRNETASLSEKEWWILKPSMSDKGHGIRIFSSEYELQSIFEEWEAPEGEDDDDTTDITTGSEGTRAGQGGDGGSVDGMTSQLRHFVVQPYVTPLVFPSLASRKFHVRTYVLCLGALKIYVFRRMLALFAEMPYEPPNTRSDMRPHLTNTSLQRGDVTHSVRQFWDLPDGLPGAKAASSNWKHRAYGQIKTITGELFQAAVAQPTNFQPLPNAFEIYGIDWLVDAQGKTWLLEVNAFPDFAQTGSDLKDLVAELWKGVLGLAVQDFFDVDTKDTSSNMDMVLELDLGRK